MACHTSSSALRIANLLKGRVRMLWYRGLRSGIAVRPCRERAKSFNLGGGGRGVELRRLGASAFLVVRGLHCDVTLGQIYVSCRCSARSIQKSGAPDFLNPPKPDFSTNAAR